MDTENTETPEEQQIHHDGGCICRSCEVDRYWAEQELLEHNEEKQDGPGYEVRTRG